MALKSSFLALTLASETGGQGRLGACQSGPGANRVIWLRQFGSTPGATIKNCRPFAPRSRIVSSIPARQMSIHDAAALSRDHEENVDTDEAAAEGGHFEVVEEHAEHGKRAQPVDVATIG
jgi:hypothetical protein